MPKKLEIVLWTSNKQRDISWVLKLSMFFLFHITANDTTQTVSIWQVVKKRQYNWHFLQMENAMNYSLSIWGKKPSYPFIFVFLYCLYMTSLPLPLPSSLFWFILSSDIPVFLPCITSRQLDLTKTFLFLSFPFVALCLPLLKRRSAMENSFQSSYRIRFRCASPNRYCRLKFALICSLNQMFPCISLSIPYVCIFVLRRKCFQSIN